MVVSKFARPLPPGRLCGRPLNGSGEHGSAVALRRFVVDNPLPFRDFELAKMARQKLRSQPGGPYCRPMWQPVSVEQQQRTAILKYRQRLEAASGSYVHAALPVSQARYGTRVCAWKSHGAAGKRQETGRAAGVARGVE